MKFRLILLSIAAALLVWAVAGYIPEDGSDPVEDSGTALEETRRTDPAAVRGSRQGGVRTDRVRSVGAADGMRVQAWPERQSREKRTSSGIEKYSREKRISAIRQSYSLNRDAVPDLLRALAEDPDEKVRMEALLALDAIDGDAAIDALTAGLSDDDVIIRQQVLEALWSRGSETTHFLGEVLFGDPDPWVRLRAVELLAEDGGEASKSLLQAALEDADPEVRSTAEALLSSWVSLHPEVSTDSSGIWVADPGLAEAGFAVQGGIDNPDPEERIVALHQLAYSQGEEAADVLGEILNRDLDAAVRREALGALESIGGSAAVTSIAKGLGDRDTAIRQRVIEALWKQGSQTVHLIGQALFSDPDPAVRFQAVELLAADASPAARALLLSATEDPDEGVRRIARQKLNLPQQ
ncbi:MAG: HEAT repeat domain-containing protein [Gammaproteobacteria bacterium]|nr:HEAT repeat domain-containing protein [Gammaproteobacteria bacterium]